MVTLGVIYGLVAKAAHKAPKDPTQWELSDATAVLFPLLGASVLGFIGAQLGVTLPGGGNASADGFLLHLGTRLGADGTMVATIAGVLLILFTADFLARGSWSIVRWLQYPTVPQAIKGNALMLCGLLGAVAASWKQG